MKESQLAVQIRNVAKDYAGEKALKGLSLDIAKGSLFGLIGADGAGKTTLLNLLATLRDADSGQLRVLGCDPGREYAELRCRIGYMPQRFSLYADLSVQENLDFFATLFGLSALERRERMDKLLQFAGLAEFRARRAGALSGGMKQKLALSCILLHEPELLLLDEPTVGVDPVARRDFWLLLRTLRDEGRTIIVSTPYMDEAEMCSSLALLHNGRLLALGKPASLIAQFPYPVISVESAAPLRWALSRPCPSGVKSIYPMGGKLHVIVEAGFESETLQKMQGMHSPLRQILPPDCTISLIQPGIEDLFLGLLTGAIAESVYQPQSQSEVVGA
jgi:ABC-2 type transport system ATP-binding protein